MLPHFLSHERQSIRKGRQGLAIPGVLPDRDLAFLGMRVSQQSHQREEAQQSRCGAGDSPIGPLALGLDAQVVSDFMKSDFELPAHHEPLQNLFWLFGQVSAQQSLRFELAFRIPDQNPTDGQRRHTAVKPNRCTGRYFDFSSSLAIPIRNDHFLPTSLNIFLDLLQSGQAFALLARPAILSRRALGSRFIQSCIQPKTGDQGDRMGKFGHSQQEIEGSKAGIHYHNQFSAWQPASGLQKHLPGPVGQLLVSSLALFIVPFRWSQYCQEGQRPDPLRPRNGCQQHQAQPAQATGFDKMTVAGAHRIPIDPFGLDLGSPATFYGIVQSHHHRPKYGKRSHQQPQKQPTGFSARPNRTIEHSMEILKVLFSAQPHNPQYGSHRPLPGCKDCSQQQDLYMLPNTLGKKSGECCQDRGIFASQGGLGPFSRQSKMTVAYLAFC